MSMTITEKIITAHTRSSSLRHGQLIMAQVDIALANDITAPLAIQEFQKVKPSKVYDNTKVVFVLDHFVPNRDVQSAGNCQAVKRFAESHDIKHVYDGSNGGIEHILLPQKGLVTAGDIVAGADSHTCTCGGIGALGIGVGSTDLAYAMLTGEMWLKVPETVKVIFNGKRNPWVYGKDLILRLIGDSKPEDLNYKILEFSGNTIRDMNMEQRFTICNMAVEAGAKSGIIEPDEKTKQFLANRSLRPPLYYSGDTDAPYCSVLEYDSSFITPLVALPPSPRNIKSIYDINHIDIDQVIIGACTNGWLADLEIAAHVVRNKKVHSDVRFLIFPGTQEILGQALKKGLIDILVDAGAIICPPSCGPCLGGHLGVLADGEHCLSTTNRNFIGRMGHIASKVYLSNPAIAAASAILGHIGSPDDLGLKENPS